MAYDFTVDVSAAYPKKVPVIAYIPDKPADSSEGEENASLSLFINVHQFLARDLKSFIHAKRIEPLGGMPQSNLPLGPLPASILASIAADQGNL